MHEWTIWVWQTYKSYPQSRTLPGDGPTWAYLPYSPLKSESKVECKSKHKHANPLCTSVYVLISATKREVGV